MHVALNGYFWKRPFVGSGQYLRQLVYHLNRSVSDLDITLICPQEPGEVEPEGVPPSVHVKLVPVRPGNVGKVLFEQIYFPRACREVGADVVHVPYWGGPLRSPVPLVVTVHDLTTLLIPEYRRPFKARFYNALVSASARGADHVITDSFSSKLDIMDHLQIAEEKVTAVYLAAGSQYTSGKNDLMEMAILRKYDLPDFYVLYLGGYELHKNVTTLLLAYTYVAQSLGEEYPLVLAGRKPTTPSAIYPDYDDYIRRLGLEKYVRWIGYVDEEDKPVLYRNAETFVFPSRYEGFGLPPLEAMACGTPVVTTNGSSLPEVVSDAAFAVDADDARDMAGAIIATLIQDNLAADLRFKGPQQAGKFSWEKTAVETAVIYDRLVRMKGEG
ncbi:MAG: glycosyltransferase family 4 protein [Ardenticatenaceae bacterium]|nr:glycosyltransferase family 4 protein [Anaerolineales bacterium]MCB8921426.1 glycosyltransferase family 4 protein [Ardenticatenaceae bacterium]MCB8991543.1 glycosyltransferase family 4 protein [Ardenticatenaceae bacterium]MCB9005095.1 glycosyltransferase family 4 protein [Ardenticatenaceae bacterium]